MNQPSRQTPLQRLVGLPGLCGPGVLHASASLAAAGTSRADAIARGFGGAAEGPAIDGRWLAGGVMVIAGLIALYLIIQKLRRWRSARAASSAAVMRDVRRKLRLTRRQTRRLRCVAREMQLEHPTTLLLCPSLLRQARRRLPPTDARDLDRILLRLAA